MLIPYEVDVPFDRRPWSNYAMLVLIVLAFLLQVSSQVKYDTQMEKFEDAQDNALADANSTTPQSSVNNIKTTEPVDPVEAYVLRDFSFKGLFGHMWLHGGILHLLGNMIFLWVFGNAVCSKIGNLIYWPVYLGLGIAAGIGQLTLDGSPAIGASGAINGVVGMYFIMFPRNDISCLLFINIRPYAFSLSSYWVILWWLFWDIIGATMLQGHVAHWAHLSGFFVGAAIAIAMLLTKIVVMEKDECSLLKIFNIQKGPEIRLDRQGRQINTPAFVERPDQIDNSISQQDVRPEKLPQKPVEPAPELSFDFNTMPPDFNFGDMKLDLPSQDQPLQTSQPAVAQAAPKPQTVKINAGDMLIRFSCSCGHKYKVPNTHAGKKARCAKCSAVITVPKPAAV